MGLLLLVFPSLTLHQLVDLAVGGIDVEPFLSGVVREFVPAHEFVDFPLVRMQPDAGCKDEGDLYTALLRVVDFAGTDRVFLDTKCHGDIILGGFQSP